MEPINGAITAKPEAKILDYLEKKTPAWIKPDFLTFAALLSGLAGGIAYIFAVRNDVTLIIVNVCILIHWIADSLDGRVAKLRKIYQPRYGFYIDHIFDSTSVVLILGGLVISPLTRTMSWAVVAIMMLMVLINTFLKIHAFNSFKISMGMFGPTEARFGLIVFNFFIFFVGNPNVFVFGETQSLVDFVGWIVSGFMAIILVPDIARTILTLKKTDKIKSLDDQAAFGNRN